MLPSSTLLLFNISTGDDHYVRGSDVDRYASCIADALNLPSMRPGDALYFFPGNDTL